MAKVAIVIPARYGSSRLPGKALADIAGKTMIHRVYDQVRRVKNAHTIIVATDDQRIEAEVHRFGGYALMTSPNHESGTDRIAEAISLAHESFDFVVNVQGDEPMIEPKQVEDFIDFLTSNAYDIATQCVQITDANDLFNYNVVKLVKSATDHVLYFSRQAIPAHRDLPYRSWLEKSTYFRHIGMYGFKTNILQKLSSLPPSGLEKAESLEQLRWLENDFAIYAQTTSYQPIGVDTQEDLERVIQLLS